jgi:hypothetical protein
MHRLAVLISILLFIVEGCLPVRKMNKPLMEATGEGTDAFMSSLLGRYPQYFDSIIKNKKEWNVQIIYTQIDRTARGKIQFTDQYYNLNPDQYFYPASTVKLPVAVLALQKLRELNIPGLDMNSSMITEADYSGQTEVYNDPGTPDGRPTIAQYIKKILLVSDNDAFNRLYEFLGQEYINHTLHNMGYDDVQIIHRLNIFLTEDENRHTNPIKFYDTTGKMIYEKPAEKSSLEYARRNTKMGKGFIRNGNIVNEPFDFSAKNRLSIPDLHNILKAVIFPDKVPDRQRFHLSPDDYAFLHQYMSMFPRESVYPTYDSTYMDAYSKFLLWGEEKGQQPGDIRIFHKSGDAYGFMTDAAYVADFKNKIEFMVTATIYCNSDGIFNDDKYDYETIGLPFFKNLGKVIYEYELKRKRKHLPDLTNMQFNYLK